MLGIVMHAIIPLTSPAWRVNLLSVLLSTCAPLSLSLFLSTSVLLSTCALNACCAVLCLGWVRLIAVVRCGGERKGRG